MSAPRYQYVVADLLTDTNLANLPLSNVSFERRISRVAGFKGELAVTTRQQATLVKYLQERWGRCSLYVYRNGVLWWGGIIWTFVENNAPRGGDSVSIQAATFDSYSHHRYMKYKQYLALNTDPSTTIVDLWDELQTTHANANIGVNPSVDGIVPVGSVVPEVSVFATDAKKYGELIEELGDGKDGPEHTIDVVLEGATRKKYLRVGPKLGNTISAPLSITGRRLASWSTVTDATNSGTSFQARGATSTLDPNPGEDESPAMSVTYSAEDLLEQGWPILDVTVDVPGVSDVATLNNYAQAERSLRTKTSNVPSFEVYLDPKSSGWTPNNIGDVIRIRRSPLDIWMESSTEDVRPVAITVTPPDNSSPEIIQFAVEES